MILQMVIDEKYHISGQVKQQVSLVSHEGSSF